MSWIYWAKVKTQLVKGLSFAQPICVGQFIRCILLNNSSVSEYTVSSFRKGLLSFILIGQNYVLGPRSLLEDIQISSWKHVREMNTPYTPLFFL